jgi:ketosteroid isomerase-like protein
MQDDESQKMKDKETKNRGEEGVENEKVQERSAVRGTILSYFEGINEGKEWEDFIAEDMAFTPFGDEGKRVNGKQGYVVATSRFLQVARSVEIKELIVEDNKACAIASYKLHSPNGDVSTCNVAEIFSVKDGKIKSSSIFFDTSAFSSFIAPFIASYQKGELRRS